VLDVEQKEIDGMNPRQKTSNDSDAIAGAALITIGAVAIIVRLGLLTVNIVSQDVVQWWPLLLIVLGVGLWALEQEHRQKPAREREAKYVR
jgi:hypothetical protein